jgi:hypothetical protein
MSQKERKFKTTKAEAKVENPQRRKLLSDATKLAVYTAPVLFTISNNAFGESTAPGKTPLGKNASGRKAPSRAGAEDFSVPPPP